MIRCGVVGAGVFGGYHARKVVSLAGAALAGVADPDIAKARALAELLGTAAFDDYDALLACCEAVIVTAPAVAHADLANRALIAGKAVYVEKPLATTSEDAWALVASAAERRLILACGHQERLVMGAMGLFDTPEQPFRIESVRRGPPSDRNLDVSCVQDLMVHDLDLALVLAASGPSEIEAVGDPNAVRAAVTFESGLTALFESSRIAEARSRTTRVFYPS
ncbi:MAG: Gfo/Idh/MocA family oxidoreductase, partial [Caulobacteraceae bacterium]